MNLVRIVVSATCITLASVGGVALVASDAHAQTTKPVEYYSGMVLTAKVDHVLPLRHRIAKGTKAKITKRYTSSGNLTHVDLKIGDFSVPKVPIQKIRDSYDK